MKKIITRILRLPKIVAFQPIAYCTLDWEYCILKDLNFGKKSNKSIMRFSEFKKIIDDISWWCYQIVFSGCEPLLNKELWKMLDYAREKKIHTTVATNAQFIEERFVELTLSPPDRLIVAYDHPDKNYKRHMDALRAYKGSGILKDGKVYREWEIILRMVLTKKNFNRIDEFYEVANDVADYAEIKSLGIWPEGDEAYQRKMKDDYVLYKHEHNISRYYFGANMYQRKPGRCKAVDKPTASIRVDGSIRPCWYLLKPDPVGNALTQNFLKVWFSRDFRKLRREMKFGTKWEACNRCLGIGGKGVKTKM